MTGRSWRTPILVLISATAILFLTFGTRQTYGLLLDPVSTAHGWGREVFAFAIALQSLFWGLSQPLWGAVADRYGAGRVVSISGALFAVGLWLMSSATTALGMNFACGLLTGIAMSGTGFPILLAVVGRSVAPERRSLYLGIASAGGSSGQLLIVPAAQVVISSHGYATALVVLAAMTAIVVPLSAVIAGRGNETAEPGRQLSIVQQVREAARHRGYLLLVTGFFVCGFQTMFIGTHLPAYLADRGAPPALGATALAMIGLFNMIGCFAWGGLGGRFSKKYLLAALYTARSLFIVVFILSPLSETGVLLFAALMGITWLATVPLTSGLVAQIFGTQYMAMLYGFAFLSHQIGSFLGIWLGGVVYDRTGSYDPIWWIAIVLGLVAALLHWPIDERAVPRLAAQR